MADASTKVASTTLISYVSSGASIAAAAFSVSTDINAALTSTNTKQWPRADLYLQIPASSTTSSTAMTIPCFRRDINIDGGTNDEAIPNTLSQPHFVGNFQLVSSVASSAHMYILDVPLPGGTDCEFYISNALTNTIGANWKLYVLPKTDVGATA